jgi:hypothetical protein
MLLTMALPSLWSKAANTALRIAGACEHKPHEQVLPLAGRLDSEIEAIKPRDKHPLLVQKCQTIKPSLEPWIQM